MEGRISGAVGCLELITLSQRLNEHHESFQDAFDVNHVSLCTQRNALLTR